MYEDKNNKTEDRICQRCGKSFGEKVHGNRKYHPECYKASKKDRQKENYQIGNEVKLMIKKNERIAARLHEIDKQKDGISHIYVLECGFIFDCPTFLRKYEDKEVHMLHNYGYIIETINEETLILFFHESELT